MYSIGLMSGTSMDGIDAALLETDGKFLIKDLGHTSITYDPRFKMLLKAAEYTVHWCEGNLSKAKSSYQDGIKKYLEVIQKIPLAEINQKLIDLANYFSTDNIINIAFDKIIEHSTFLHAQIVKELLAEKNYSTAKIDVIGFHGQTLFHRPAQKISIIIGDGQLLANQTGINVVNDFRSNDIAHGGQGAPLAPLYHQALAIRDQQIPITVVNCGGIANVSFITGRTENDVIAFDTGPGNGLIDRYIQQRTQGKELIDAYGKYGKKGKVNDNISKILKEEAVQQAGKNFFSIIPPKSLDINDLELTPLITEELNKISLEDALATLEIFTANTIVDSANYIKNPPKTWILAGGGWKNPVILEKLKEKLQQKIGKDVVVKTADEFGWNSQAMEAQIFAYLAVRSLKKLPLSVPNTTGVIEPLSGGRIYLHEKVCFS